MIVRKIISLMLVVAGALWLALFAGAFCEFNSARAQDPAPRGTNNLSGQAAMKRAFPFICFAARVRGYDLFANQEERQISLVNVLERDTHRQMAFAVMLISLGLIAFVGPLIEPLREHHLQQAILYSSIGALGGGTAFFIRVTWEFTQR